jgi:hypothetical protein
MKFNLFLIVILIVLSLVSTKTRKHHSKARNQHKLNSKACAGGKCSSETKACAGGKCGE